MRYDRQKINITTIMYIFGDISQIQVNIAVSSSFPPFLGQTKEIILKGTPERAGHANSWQNPSHQFCFGR